MKSKFIITGLFVVGLMFTGYSVNAMGASPSDVQSSGAVIVATDNSQSGAVVSYAQTLRRGVKNSNVLALQKKLQSVGYYTKALDSDYGPATYAAVIKFQRAHNLSVDGVAGPKTFAQILSLTGIVPSLTSPPVTDACTAVYAPVCGQQTINCLVAPCDQPAPKTFSNKCAMNAAGATYKHAGKCDLTKPIEDGMSDHAIKKLISELEDQIKRLENHIDDLKAKIKRLKAAL